MLTDCVDYAKYKTDSQCAFITNAIVKPSRQAIMF